MTLGVESGGFLRRVRRSSAVSLHCKSGCLWDARQLFDRMHDRNSYVILGSRESSAYVMLAVLYSVLGRGEDVERVWRTMELRGGEQGSWA